MMPNRPTQLPERNLDVLRAGAVLAVFANHAIEIFTDHVGPLTVKDLGRDGVLLFFVHTSLVLMTSLERQGVTSPSWIRTFYRRRAFRIYPLALVVIACVLVFRIPPGVGWDFKSPSWLELFANISLTQNIFAVQPLVGPLWTLPIEVQMYLLLPVLWLISLRWELRGVTVALVAACAIGLLTPASVHSLQTLRFGPCFVAGVLAYTIRRKEPRAMIPAVLFAPAVLGLVCMFALVQHFPLPVWGEWSFCILVALLTSFTGEMRESPFTMVAKRIATYSYGIYLVHVPMLFVGYKLMAGYPTWLRGLVVLGGTVGLSVLLYHTVERPFIAIGSGKRAIAGATAPEAGVSGMREFAPRLSTD